jgi:ABC-type multidrug transport system permease subunit
VRKLRVLATTSLLEIRTKIANPFALLPILAQPLAFALIAAYAVRSTGHLNHLPYALVGGGLVGMWGSTLFNAGFDLTNERVMRTFDALLGSPTPIWFVTASKVAASTCLGATSFVVTLPLGSVVVGGAGIGIHDVGLAAVSAVEVLIGFFAVAMLLAPLFVRSTAASFANTLVVPAYILGGFMFPPSVLPHWLQWIGDGFAPSWGVRALYASCGVEAASNAWANVTAGFVVSGATLVAGFVAFRALERAARRSGTFSAV